MSMNTQLMGMSRFISTVSYFNNAECILLLQDNLGGFIHIMDDQTPCAFKKTNQTMVAKRQGNHLPFKVGALDQSGFINPFAKSLFSSNARPISKMKISLLQLSNPLSQCVYFRPATKTSSNIWTP
jgi:hypothetical protein